MYIVTGGAGFIGSAMVWELNRRGVEDVLVVDRLGCTEKWKNLIGLKYAGYMHCDDFLGAVRDGSLDERLALNNPLGRSLPIRGIVHMGACSSTTERDADFLMRNNLEYSKTLANFALERGIRFVNASSAATYGDGAQGFDDDEDRLDELKPLNMYGYSKHLFDLWARRTGRLKHMASLKFFNVYGPNEYHKGEMRSVAHKGFGVIGETGGMRLFRSNDHKYSDGGQMRDFVYVKDCTAVMWWLLGHPAVSGVFNLGTGRARSWNELAAALFKAMGRPENIEYIDMPETLRGKYQNFTQANMDKLKRSGCVGGDVPLHSLEEGVADYIRNYLSASDPYLRNPEN